MMPFHLGTTCGRSLFLALAFVTAGATMSEGLAAQAIKCVIDGKVSYQSTPCPTGQTRPPPTVEQLNRERQEQRRAASRPNPKTPATVSGASTSLSVTPELSPGQSRCDGRKYCSQMTSCPEAKYFLSNCPGVEMDGDHDGIPCEQQWCK